MTHTVTFFTPCPLTEGQKIRISDSPLAGDWEVIAITRSKITLRCPISGKELTKDRLFCFTEEKEDVWPKKD